MRFLLIDKILEYDEGKSAVGVKDVTMSEDFLADHFPKFPVMPGVLQVEAMLQLASWLVFVTSGFAAKTKVVDIKGAKFSGFVRPGDKMIINVKLTSVDDEGVQFSATVSVDDKVTSSVKSGRLSYVDIEELEDPDDAKAFFKMLSNH